MQAYHRLNCLLAILAFMVMLLVVPALVFGADASGGVSVVYTSGHSHGGSDSIDPDTGGILSFEEGIVGASLYYLSFTAHKDSEGNRHEEAYILAVHLRPRLKVTDKFHLYPIAGPAMDLSSGNPRALIGAGFDYWFEDIAVSPCVWTIVEQDRDYRGVGLFLRFSF